MTTDEQAQVYDGGFEIAYELLREAVPSITEDRINKIWALCKNNPYNAVPLHYILETVES